MNSDNSAREFRFSANPQALTYQTFSSFVQDEIAVRPDHLYVSIGTKLEHNYFNGFNLQPSARITWAPEDRDMFWAAVSGAQRTPSRGETGVRDNEAVYPGPDNLPILISIVGNPAQKNERLIATEAGFRKALTERLSFDSAIFFNHYQDLISGEPGPPRLETDPPPVHLLMPFAIANLLHGETHGIEAFAGMKLADRWTLSPGYTFLTMHLHRDATGLDVNTGPETEGGIPNQQAQLRSNVNLPWHWEWTTSAYFVGRLAAPKIASYTRLDVNLAWQPVGQIVVGRGGTEPTPGSSPGVLRLRLDGDTKPGPPQCLCQAHVAVLNVHDVIGSAPAVPWAHGPRVACRLRGPFDRWRWSRFFCRWEWPGKIPRRSQPTKNTGSRQLLFFILLNSWIGLAEKPDRYGQFAGSVHPRTRPISGVARGHGGGQSNRESDPSHSASWGAGRDAGMPDRLSRPGAKQAHSDRWCRLCTRLQF